MCMRSATVAETGVGNGEAALVSEPTIANRIF